MHELIHVGVLLFSLCGAAALLVSLLWPLAADHPLTPPAKAVLGILIALGAASLLVEWTIVH